MQELLINCHDTGCLVKKSWNELRGVANSSRKLLEQVAGSTKPCRRNSDAMKEFKCGDAEEKLHHLGIAPLLASSHAGRRGGRWGAQMSTN